MNKEELINEMVGRVETLKKRVKFYTSLREEARSIRAFKMVSTYDQKIVKLCHKYELYECVINHYIDMEEEIESLKKQIIISNNGTHHGAYEYDGDMRLELVKSLKQNDSYHHAYGRKVGDK